MPNDVPFQSFEAYGTTWDTVVTGTGQFRATMAGTETAVVASTWGDVRERAREVTRKRRKTIAVPFTVVTPSTVHHGTVTGVHLGNGNPLVTWADGSKEQFDARPGPDCHVFPPLTAEEAAQAHEILDRGRKVRKDWAAFEAAHGKEFGGGWNLRAEVTRALDAE